MIFDKNIDGLSSIWFMENLTNYIYDGEAFGTNILNRKKIHFPLIPLPISNLSDSVGTKFYTAYILRETLFRFWLLYNCTSDLDSYLVVPTRVFLTQTGPRSYSGGADIPLENGWRLPHPNEPLFRQVLPKERSKIKNRLKLGHCPKRGAGVWPIIKMSQPLFWFFFKC